MTTRSRTWIVTAIVALCTLLAPAGAAADRPVRLISTGSADHGDAVANAQLGFVGGDPGSDRVIFTTNAQLEPGDTDTVADVYVRAGGQTKAVCPLSAIAGPSPQAPDHVIASPDASFALIDTYEQLSAADTDQAEDIYRCQDGQATLLTPKTPSSTTLVYGPLGNPGVSSDLSKFVFRTTDKLAATDANATDDLYLGDDKGALTLVSGGAAGAGEPTFGGLAADGSRVIFATNARLRPETDGDALDDVYRWEGGAYTQLSLPGAGGPAFPPSICLTSADARRAVIASYDRATVDDTNDTYDVYIVGGDQPVRIHGAVEDGPHGLLPCAIGASADLSRVWLNTDERWDPADTDTDSDLYYWDGSTARLATPGLSGGFGFAYAPGQPRAVRDGRGFVFTTGDALSSADTNKAGDVYEATGSGPPILRTDGTTDGGSTYAAAGDDGTLVISTKGALVGSDTDGRADLYLRGEDGATALLTPGAGQFDATFAGATADLSHIGFTTLENLDPTDHDDAIDLYDVGPAPATAGGGGGSGGGGSPPPSPDKTAPVITKLRLSTARFRAASKKAHKTKKPPVGMTLTFSSSEAGNVILRVGHVASGRLKGKSCVAGRKTGKACTKVALKSPSIKLAAQQGANKLRFEGSLDGKHRLARGRYELRVQVSDAAGNVSKTVSKRFSVVR